MSSQQSSNQTSAGNEEDDDFPIAAIVCIAVGAYVIIIIAIIIIKHMLSSHGSCKSDCCQPVEDGRRPCCCTLCAKAGEGCTCCSNCHLNGCLTKICGKPKRTNCIDILLCNCGGCTENCCTCCKCSCNCLQDVKCCARSSGPSCFSCKNCCSDICCDAPDAGACGCLCLEVKLRSPRHGSTRRSQSAPPVNEDSEKQFSTHFPPKKESERRIAFTRNGSAGDLIRSKVAVSDSSMTNLKLRSTSLSPFKARDPSASNNRNQNTSSRVSKNVLLTRTNSSKISDASINSNNSHTSELDSQRSTKNVHRGEQEKSKLRGNHRTSRQRKSLRVGRQSQRFPQHVLVSLDSQDSGVSLSLPSSDHQNVVKFHSMPVQRSVSTRPLPTLKDRSRNVKLSKTH